MRTSGEFFKTTLGREIYFEKTNRTTSQWIVFLNGLSDSLEPWKKVCKYIHSDKNFLWVDLIGQGHSLEREFHSGENFSYKVSAHDQAQCLSEVIRHLEIESIDLLVGFSYGGGIATQFTHSYPGLVDQLLLMLPYVIRLDQAFPLQRLWAQQFKMLKTWPLANPAAQIFERAYSQFLHGYMDYRFSFHVPDPLRRQASVELTEGIMDFNGFKLYSELSEKSIHLVTVDKDTLVPRSLYSELWNKIPEKQKVSWLRLIDGEHLILDQRPMFCAQWIEFILNNEFPKHSQEFVGETHESWVQDIHSKQEYHLHKHDMRASSL